MAESNLDALDPAIPSLASEAAVDLDNYIISGVQDFDAVMKLGERLVNSFDVAGHGGSPKPLIDRATLTVLGEALASDDSACRNSRLELLLPKAVRMAEYLTSINGKTEKADIEAAREFCVALSNAVTGYQKSIRDLQPSHPFRR